MASEEFKAKCTRHLEGIQRAHAVYNPPGVSTSILFANNAEICIIGTQFSNDELGHLYGKDEIFLICREYEAAVVIAEGEFYNGDRMLPKAITPHGERLTITIGSKEESHTIADLLHQPLKIKQ
jgi:hypothetical protein